MGDYVEIIRRVVAIIVSSVAASMIVFYLLKSLQLAAHAAQGKATFRTQERLPIKYAVFIIVAMTLAMIGMVLWAPQLVSLVPYGLAFALLLSISGWLNLRIRQHFAQRRQPERNEDS